MTNASGQNAFTKKSIDGRTFAIACPSKENHLGGNY
jgi:hypothetical protein